MTTATPGYTPTRRGASVLVPLAASLLIGTAAVVLGAAMLGRFAAELQPGTGTGTQADLDKECEARWKIMVRVSVVGERVVRTSG